jgi:hypothetical protein
VIIVLTMVIVIQHWMWYPRLWNTGDVLVINIQLVVVQLTVMVVTVMVSRFKKKYI